MSDALNKPYERVQLFSGGGSRFGYYLGSYAALVDYDLTPDIIIGTCGGSLSALLVQVTPDPKQLRQLMCSSELYRVIKAIRHVNATEARLSLKMRYSLQAMKRWRLSSKPSRLQRQQRVDTYQQVLDELQQLAMFRIDDEAQWLEELSEFLPTDSSVKNSSPDIAIIASRLTTTANHAPQLQELLFAPKPLLPLQDNLVSPVHTVANRRINQFVNMPSEWDMATAVRASMADMYYLPPIHDQDLGWCLGGVINLTPIELACQLANTVFAETKAGYDTWLAAPAIGRIFGFDPNQRLTQVHDFVPSANQSSNQLHWLPFPDNGQILAGSVQKRFGIRQMTVKLIHHDYDGFIQQMQAQWQYGYQRTADYIKKNNL